MKKEDGRSQQNGVVVVLCLFDASQKDSAD